MLASSEKVLEKRFDICARGLKCFFFSENVGILLIGWLVDWLVGWLVGWLVVCDICLCLLLDLLSGMAA